MQYNWISVKDRAPNDEELQRSRCWDFLCDVMIPENGGGFYRRYKVLGYDMLDRRWSCKDMIVTRWCEIEAPEE